MARTRAQDKQDNAEQPPPKSKRAAKKAQPKARTKASAESKKHPRAGGDGDKGITDENAPKEEELPTQKKAKSSEAQQVQETEDAGSLDKAKLNAIMEAYGVLPLSDSGLIEPSKPTPETILALVYMAMLTSARISHVMAYESVKCLLEAGYHDLKTLKASTWQDRTVVLTKGGYTRYREKTATALGELAEFVEEEYDGDLNNLLKRADSSPTKVRALLQEIKGIGRVGTDIFCDAAQAAWPILAPFIDPRSTETAKHCGLGSNVESMWEAVGKNPIAMCKLSSALTMVRLDKKTSDFQ